MNIDGKKIWQQAAGDTDRNYSELCLNWDVILNGPAYAGAWPECKAVLKDDGWSSKKITDLRRFCEDIQDGDIIILRLGTTDILGVGEVVGSYEWMDEFGDVDGWDLQHVRRVRWLWKYQEKPKSFPVYTLKQGDTTQPINSDIINKWLTNLNIPKENYSKELTIIPKSKNQKEITFEEISEYLYDKGISSNSIENLLKEIDELVRIAKWYKKFRQFGKPSEFETVAYLVIPILRALGWTPQKMAVEWNNVDVALFNQLPRNDSNLTVVVEAKKMDNSCLSAFSQAEQYAKGKTTCERLIVSDGLRYGVYFKEKGQFILKAYMNLTNLREEYPIYNCSGVKDALLFITPEYKE
ncbi:MAG: hypothetical protein WAR79_14215 [Melioribacteraceae bacterium]